MCVFVILSKRLFYMVNNISADSVGVCQSLGTNAFSLEIIFPFRHAITTFRELHFVQFHYKLRETKIFFGFFHIFEKKKRMRIISTEF